jgi:hypothetical protein
MTVTTSLPRTLSFICALCLQPRIFDGKIIAHIALGSTEPFINIRDVRAERALFAVCPAYEMLEKLGADYQAAF